MAGWLVAAAIVGVGAGQARSAIHEKFTLRLQHEIIDSLVHEAGETRASRQSGATLRNVRFRCTKSQRFFDIRDRRNRRTPGTVKYLSDRPDRYSRGLESRAGRRWSWLNRARCSPIPTDRKSTRLNSSHTVISYAVFCLK